MGVGGSVSKGPCKGPLLQGIYPIPRIPERSVEGQKGAPSQMAGRKDDIQLMYTIEEVQLTSRDSTTAVHGAHNATSPSSNLGPATSEGEHSARARALTGCAGWR